MQQVIKSIKVLGFALLVGFCLTTINVKAQSPADDPGIGGVGSPSVGTGADGGPVVPFDGDLSIMLIAAGIAYGYKKLKKGSLLFN